MNHRLTPILVAAALAVAALAPLCAGATGRPAPQRVVSRGLVDRTDRLHAQQSMLATHKNDRTLYGRIDAIHGNTLIVRARNGRLQNIDASDALRSGMYSAPLFLGKVVLVTGYFDAARTLHAQSITRETRLDASTGPDR